VALNCTIKNASANTMPVIETMPDAIAGTIATVADGLLLDTDCAATRTRGAAAIRRPPPGAHLQSAGR